MSPTSSFSLSHYWPEAPEPKEWAPEALYAEPIVGWRLWQIGPAVTPDTTAQQLLALLDAEEESASKAGTSVYKHLTGPRLKAWGAYGAWPARHAMEAACSSHAHDAPAFGCACGLWAFKNEQDAYDKCGQDIGNTVAFALGRVNLWGRVAEHEKGYRAQYGYPLDLTIINGTQDKADELARIYNVPAALASRELLQEQGAKAKAAREAAEALRDAHYRAMNSLMVGLSATTTAPKPSRFDSYMDRTLGIDNLALSLLAFIVPFLLAIGAVAASIAGVAIGIKAAVSG